MGKKTLVIGHSLTNDMEFSGKFLTKELQKSGLDISAAMWFFYTEISSWKYIVVSNNFEDSGPAFIYSLVDKINKNSKSQKYQKIKLDAIEAKGENSFIYRLMKGLFHVEAGGSIRLTNTMVNGLEINDCLIYKIK